MFLLFDIDGTLIVSDNAGRRALELALWETFQVREVPDVPFSGRTDQFIFRELLRVAGLPSSDDHYELLRESYLGHLPTALRSGNGQVLPGVVSLLQALSEDPACHLGLLTGNLPESARMKLGHFELLQYFDFGVYGDHSHDRCDLASEAVAILRGLHGEHLPEQVWIIGDTDLDVACGKHIRARTLACCTGTQSADELQAAGADFVLASLHDTPLVLELLRSAPGGQS